MKWFTSMFKRGEVKDLTLKDAEAWAEIMASGKTGSGVYVNENNALKISAVYGCVRILAETIAGLPVKVYRRTEDGREKVENHSLEYLFNTLPNKTQTSFELKEFVMASLGLQGNSYCQKVMNGSGQVVRLVPLLPCFVDPRINTEGELEFKYTAPGQERTFRQDEIWRVAGLGSNGITGLSPVGLARESFGLAMASETSAGRMYSNGAQIPGVLQFPGKLDPEIIEKLRDQFAKHHGGPENAHKPMILESGMSYNQIGMNAKDAQFLEGRTYQTLDIARWFRVPPHKLGELDRATFSNIEHQSIEFVTDTILPWCRRLEESIQRDLFSEAERRQMFVRFNLDGLLRGDTQSRYEAYGKAINDGWLSRNEVRRIENHNPVPGLDEYLVPLNMSEAGQEQEDRVSNWLATKEINALNNCQNEDMEKWALDFYTRHAENVKELCGMSEEQCASYAVSRINTLKSEGLAKSKATAIESLKEAVNA